jgi:hypothetical protein
MKTPRLYFKLCYSPDGESEEVLMTGLTEDLLRLMVELAKPETEVVDVRSTPE